jgi:ketosteroid isomerase-like protein
MSQENVQVIRASVAAYNEGDLDALLERYDPDVEFVTLLLGNYRGREAIRRLVDENQQNLPGYGYEIKELIDAGDTVVAVLGLTGAGRVSEISLGDDIAFAFTFRNGLVVRQQTFSSKADALEAAGLAE